MSDDKDKNQIKAVPNNVVSLAKATNNALMHTVEQLLEQELKRIRSGEVVANKALILYLNDVGEKGNQDFSYDVGFSNANLKFSEMLSLMKVASTAVSSYLIGLMDWGE